MLFTPNPPVHLELYRAAIDFLAADALFNFGTSKVLNDAIESDLIEHLQQVLHGESIHRVRRSVGRDMGDSYKSKVTIGHMALERVRARALEIAKENPDVTLWRGDHLSYASSHGRKDLKAMAVYEEKREAFLEALAADISFKVAGEVTKTIPFSNETEQPSHNVQDEIALLWAARVAALWIWQNPEPVVPIAISSSEGPSF